MTTGIATWDTVEDFGGPVLLIVNSERDAVDEVTRVLASLSALAGRPDVYVIAAGIWKRLLLERGVPQDRLLLPLDDHGDELELNYFLSSPVTAAWITKRDIRAVVGSSPHSLYNEEVKEVFERAVAMVLASRPFIAHALPAPFLYVLTLADLLRRAGRGAAVEEYRARCRDLVDECHALWREHGSPAVADGEAFNDIAKALRRTIGPAIAAPRSDPYTQVAPFIAELTERWKSGGRLLELKSGFQALNRARRWLRRLWRREE